MEMVYISSPYTHDDSFVVDCRMEVVYGAMAFFSNEKGMHCVTPLSMHELVKRRPMPTDYKFWKEYCENLLKRCDRMIVLKQDGWETSTGVKGEVDFCDLNNIPVDYWDIDVTINK